MANSRRVSNSATDIPPHAPSFPPSLRGSNSGVEIPPIHSLSLPSFFFFLRRLRAFPVLLFIFVFLTWIFLRFHKLHDTSIVRVHPSLRRGQAWREDGDLLANLVRFNAGRIPSEIFKDERGWLVNPVSVARDAVILGGARSCASVHVGEIRSGGIRGNHRHHSFNETFVIWGAKTKFRLENHAIASKGFAEVIISPEEVAIAASPSGMAHAVVNVDQRRTTFFLGCQDGIFFYNQTNTDFNVWKDIQ